MKCDFFFLLLLFSFRISIVRSYRPTVENPIIFIHRCSRAKERRNLILMFDFYSPFPLFGDPWVLRYGTPVAPKLFTRVKKFFFDSVTVPRSVSLNSRWERPCVRNNRPAIFLIRFYREHATLYIPTIRTIPNTALRGVQRSRRVICCATKYFLPESKFISSVVTSFATRYTLRKRYRETTRTFLPVWNVPTF